MQNSPKKDTYGRVITVSLPLVMSMAATTVMEFTDRAFLANYSVNAIAAALPAGITAFLFIAFFLGVSGYVNVFVAQYTGAGAHHRVGASLWQGIWFSIFASAIMGSLAFLAGPLFSLGGHAQEVRVLEATYFRILCLGAGFHIAGNALACFFSGRGYTRPVMVVSVVGMLFNIPLDYALINGVWGFPEMGIAGAGLATVAAWILMFLCYCLLVFNRENNRSFSVWKMRRYDSELFFRLLRFGVPGALQFCMDIFAFTIFVFIVGRIGKLELAVTNVVFSINSLAFMPAMGFSVGLSTLVGQALGRNDPEGAVQSAISSRNLLLVYICCIDLVFVFLPEPVLSLFTASSLPSLEHDRIIGTGTELLRIVAVYVFFDAQYMIYSGVLKGAGDTRYLLIAIGTASMLFMILPLYIGVIVMGAGLYFAWGCVLAFILSLYLLTWWRFRKGRWKRMRVIET